MAQLLTYLDATDSPDERVEFPEVVAELEDLGFAVVGRALLDLDYEGAIDAAAGYKEEDRRAFMEHWDIPMPVLASRDGTTYADVSWWWGGPHVRLRSELEDGSLVETNRRWDNEPGLPSPLRLLWRPFNIDREMRRASVPAKGRSIEIRQGPDMAALWTTHQQHLATYSSARQSPVKRATDLPTYLRIATQAVGHDETVMRKVTSLWIATGLAWGAIAIGLVLLVAIAGGTETALRLAIAGIVLTPVVFYLIPSRLRWLPQAWRPSYL